MSPLDYWLLAMGLAVDCFSVAVLCGMLQQRVDLRQMLTMACLFGGFQAGMTWLGWVATVAFEAYLVVFGRALAFLILLLLGAKMLWESYRRDAPRHFDPCRVHTLLILAVATSVDALSVGISFTCLGFDSAQRMAYPLYLIGLMSFLLTLLGKVLGAKLGRRIKPRLAERLGGLILILIGIKIVAHI